MRTLLIFLSIGLFLTLIQYSNGIPFRRVSPEIDEDDTAEAKPAADLKSNIDNIDESDEIKPESKPLTVQVDESSQSNEEDEKVDEALKLAFGSGKSNYRSYEQNKDDDYDNDDDDDN